MTDTSRYRLPVRLAAWTAAGLLPVAAILLLTRLAALPSAAAVASPVAAGIPAFAPPRISIGLNWDVFRGSGEATPAGDGLGRRFRLAGTFLVSGAGPGDTGVRRAVLDWIERGRQEIVSEGDRLGEVVILRVGEDRVVLRAGAREETLWLSFAGGAEAERSAAGGAVPDPGTDGAAAGRFGQVVGENNWLLRRDALMQYYDELMNDPVRLLQVFDSMKPLYDEERITGYMLDIEGERDFFDAVGFREGDVVRKVNAVPMTNRGRAEHFIEQFARDTMSVFVLDIERAGEPVRMVYRIRE